MRNIITSDEATELLNLYSDDLSKLKNYICGNPSKYLQDMNGISNFKNALETIATDNEQNFKILGPSLNYNNDQVLSTPHSVIKYFIDKKIFQKWIEHYCIFINNNYSLSGALMRFQYQLISKEESRANTSDIAKVLKLKQNQLHKIISEKADSELDAIKKRNLLTMITIADSKVYAEISAITIFERSGIENPVCEYIDAFLYQAFAKVSDNQKIKNTSLEKVEHKSSLDKSDIEINRLKKLLKTFVKSEISRLSCPNIKYGAKKLKRFELLSESGFNTFTFDELIEIKNDVCNAAKMRRTADDGSVVFIYLSKLAEILSEWFSYFETASKKKFNVEVESAFASYIKESGAVKDSSIV